MFEMADRQDWSRDLYRPITFGLADLPDQLSSADSTYTLFNKEDGGVYSATPDAQCKICENVCVCVNVMCRAVLDLDWTRVDAEPPTLTTADTYYPCFSD